MAVDGAWRLVLIGPPGVGKGTLASMLESELGARQLSSGDIFRAEICGKTDLGLLAEQYTESGRLVPDDVTIRMMVKHITSEQNQQTGFVLDGFPRTVAQAESLDQVLGERGAPIHKVVCLVVGDDVVVARLGGRLTCPKCGAIYHRTNKPPKSEGICDQCGSGLAVRKDDNPETIRERLDVYRANTEPVIEYYRGSGNLLEVDASKESTEVLRYVLAQLT